MQPAAMDADFGIGVARIFAVGFAEQFLPEAVEKGALAVLDAGGEDRVSETEPRNFAHAVRQQGDTDPDLGDFGRRLVNPRRDAVSVQTQRQREAGDAGADNCDVRRCSAGHARPPAPPQTRQTSVFNCAGAPGCQQDRQLFLSS